MTPENETVNIQKIAEPVHFVLTRNAKGKYQYELSIHAKDVDTVLEQAWKLDEQVRLKLQGQMAGEIQNEEKDITSATVDNK